MKKLWCKVLLTVFLVLPLIPMSIVAEENTETEAAQTEVMTITSQTVTADPGLPGNDELFGGYVDNTLYGGMVSTWRRNLGDSLVGDEKVLYDALVPMIRQIANGERTSTLIGVGMTVSDGAGNQYIADVEATFEGETFTKESLHRVLDALLTDMPYEMYWYDKITGCQIMTLASTRIVNMQVYFEVADNYSGEAAYTVDPVITGAARNTVQAAYGIVEQYASVSDYEKLLGYKNSICELVSYNFDAAQNGNFSYNNDPWQMIYVFDGNSSTSVVCEGYAKAFMYLCDLSNFENDVACYTVSGLMGSEAHMWNIVSINGTNYHVDVTNSDTGMFGQNGGLFLAGTAGSVETGYVFNGIQYVYDSDNLAMWGTGDDSILRLAETDYVPEPDEPEPDEPEVHVHEYEVVIAAPTCTTGGHTTYTCELCGYSYVSDHTEALGHKMGEWVVIKEAKCGQVGIQHRQCERCELSEQAEIPALTHSFTNIQITAPGEEKAFCECGEYEVSYTTGWILHNGVYYYRLNDENHTLVTKDTIIDNAISEFDANGVWKGYAKAGWKQLDGDWYYLSSGGRINIGWKLLGSTWYYMDESGIMVTGWQEIDGADYFFHAGGGMAKGWVQDGSIWYYMNNSGRKIRENTVIDGCLNLFDENGVWLGYAAAGWRQDGEDWYYLGSGGKITKGWKQLGRTWYYFDANGIMQTGWLQLGSTWYYLNSSGGMVTGSVVIDGAMNEFNGSGVWLGYAKAGWKQVGSQWYYLGSGGKITKGWKQLGNTWYYFDASGIMQTGWLQLGSTWYYLNSSGAMATGWLKIGSAWYYLNNSGAMVTGWNKIGSATYYFTASGAMVTGSRVIDGVSYQFNGSGALVGTR